MSEVTDHYERLLAAHYTWMFGTSFADKVAEQKSILAQALQPLTETPIPQLAIDLGCGPGFQTIALAQLGFSPVLAIDTSAELLSELYSHATGLEIQTHQADLRELPQLVPAAQASAIVCMGDTLTHLPAKSDVTTLFHAIAKSLAPGGFLVLTWRDLTPELQGVDRFLPVRSDDNTIMTCFLEYPPAEANAETVTIHDLIYIRQDGAWTLNKSSYPKLRLSPKWLTQELIAAGLIVEFQGVAGRLLQITARKP
jgi:SAM-dependent methyltransferase